MQVRGVRKEVLMDIFGPKRDEATGQWRRLHEGLAYLYLATNIIRVMTLSRIK
jgi:hydrogenase maturation factor